MAANPQKKKANNIRTTENQHQTVALSEPIKNNYLFPALLALLSIFLYANTFGHDYVLDDAVAVLNNQFVQQGFAGIGDILKVDFWHFSNLTLGYYRPLSIITFAIEHQFFGNNSHVSHIVNVLFYSAGSFMLGLLLQQIFSKQHRAIPFFIALLFVTHPAHTEVVANIKSRDELMSFLGVVSVLYLLLKWNETSKRIFLYIGLAVFYLALLSKETAIPTLLLFPACLYFFRQKSIAQCVWASMPLLLPLIVFYIQKNAVIGEVPDFSFDEMNNYPYTEAKFTSSMSLFAHCLWVLLFPLRLVYDYSYNAIPAGSWTDPVTLLGFGLFAGLIFLTIKGIQQRSIWGFALGFFFVTFVPAIAFVWIRGGIMAERFLFAATLGFSIALVFGLLNAFTVEAIPTSTEVNPTNSWQHYVMDVRMLAAVCLIAGLYSFKTIDRNRAWKDNVTLFFTDIKHNPGSAQNNRHCGHEMLEKAIAETKDSVKRMEYFNESMFYLRRAVQINPRFGESWTDMGRAYTNVMLIPDSAIYFYRMAIKHNPGSAIAHSNLGVIYEIIGRNELASYYYNRASFINPTFADSREKAARLRQRTGVDVSNYPGGEDPRLPGAKQQTPSVNLTVPR